MYGPTETTIWSATGRILKDSRPICIGSPIANTQLYVLNESMQPAPTGVSGELYIGGDGLARGYHDNPELRRAVSCRIRSRIKTVLVSIVPGDLVKRAADGSIQFLGRLDSQVKIRGYRIELGDIESHLNQHPDVKNAVVVVQESSVSSKRLVAYFVPDGKGITAKDLRDYLAGELPGYMVPSAFVRSHRFPLTPNGKIDRKALKTTEILEEERTSELRKPRDEIEQKRQMDAILAGDRSQETGVRDQGTGVREPEWPAVDVIVGNPPFLGDKTRAEMGDEYVDNLRTLYAGRIPGQSDLVCYWFEKARAQIATGKAKRVGLLATNSIRGGANRAVLDRIKQSGDIFFAISDRDWILEGAAVNVSMVGFDAGKETERSLDGQTVQSINSDLTSASDLTKAQRLAENSGIAFIGDMKKGKLI